MEDDALPKALPGKAARDQLRASHEDRDDVVEQLRIAGGDGRLDAAELDERVGAALTARTYGELARLVSDLPLTATPAGTALTSPKDVVRFDRSGGNMTRRGRWAVPQRMELRVRGGNVKLDFTTAEISWPTLRINLDLVGGSLILITPPGIVVDADEVSVLGGNIKVKATRDTNTGVPVMLRIDVSGTVAGGNIKVRPPRRVIRLAGSS
jgi:hypothetical protein